ncbi:MAG: YifB family Mg chelatase-like AAA ATPase [Acidimicrobiales bacterium]
MIATVLSASLRGIEGHRVIVEVHIGGGLPAFNVVGLPDAACRESRDRVRAAFASSALDFPKSRVTVNLAPSSVRKVGSGLDVPIAVAILGAQGRLDAHRFRGCAFFGELGLDGALRGVPGILSLVGASGADAVVVPTRCTTEAALVEGPIVRGIDTLRDLVAALDGSRPWPECGRPPCSPPPVPVGDLADVCGQPLGVWALEVSAAGGHHLLMIGPPGAGKTLLASRMSSILPPLTRAEAVEVTRIHSVGGLSLPPSGLVDTAPFRSPHHTTSMAALVGGGTSWVRPGEVSFAHRGVLFLDELAEFPPAVLDTLRQPLEEGIVHVARARQAVSFPARFLLVAAMNPCPCGRGGPAGTCLCPDHVRARYCRRVSGPLLDRFDLRVIVSRPDVRDLLDCRPGEASGVVAARVAAAREVAVARGVRCNAELEVPDLDRVVELEGAAKSLVEHRLRTGRLSARGLHRVKRVARTLADLAGDERARIDERHVAAALELRADPAVLAEAS